MTQREFYNAIIEANLSEEITDFCKEAIVRLEMRKKARSAKPTKTQIENAAIKEKIIEFGSNRTTGFFAGDIAKEFELSIQKASGICTQMRKEGILKDIEVKVKGKGKLKQYSVYTTNETNEESEE